MKTKNNQNAYRAFLANKGITTEKAPVQESADCILRRNREKREAAPDETERKAWLARLPLGGGDSIVWLQEENPNKQLHPVIKVVFPQAPEVVVPKVKREVSVRRLPLEVEAGELGVFLMSGITQENLASAVWLAREAQQLNVSIPMDLEELRTRVRKAREVQKKQDFASLRDSNLWADQQFSRAVAKFKAMEKQGITVDKQVVKSGLYPFMEGSKLAKAQAVLAEEGFVVVLAKNAPRSSAFVQEHDMSRWVAQIVREVIEVESGRPSVHEEVEAAFSAFREEWRAECRKAVFGAVHVAEPEEEAIVDKIGRRYVPRTKRAFKPTDKAPKAKRISKSRSGSAPVSVAVPKSSARLIASVPAEVVAPLVVADLVSASTGVSRRVW